jgi:hypothetical protein
MMFQKNIKSYQEALASTLQMICWVSHQVLLCEARKHSYLSAVFQTWPLTCFDWSSLNSCTAAEKLYQASKSFLDSSTYAKGKYYFLT